MLWPARLIAIAHARTCIRLWSTAARAAAGECRSIHRSPTRLNINANETGTASSQIVAAAQSLSGGSNRLKLAIGKFLNSVRAA
jgi:methyl-accepting chemotaxis protein